METSTVGLLVNRRQSLMDNSAYTISSNFCGICPWRMDLHLRIVMEKHDWETNKVCGLETWLKLKLSKGKAYDLIIRKGSCEAAEKVRVKPQ